MKYLFFFLVPLFLSGEILFPKENLIVGREFSIKIINENAEGIQLMNPDSRGIFPFYLKKESKEKNVLILTYEPQMGGDQILDLGFTKLPFKVILGKTRQAPLEAAPLLSLIPGDPLELNLKLRDELYNKSRAKENIRIFNAYSIPWGMLIAVVLFFLAAPAILYLLQDIYRRNHSIEAPNASALLKQLKQLEISTLSSKEIVFEIAKIFKMGFKNGASQTYQELYAAIQKQNFSSEELAAFKAQFDSLEKLQYRPELPVATAIQSAIQNTAALLQSR